MSSDLKKLVEALEKVLHEQNSSLDAPAREAFQEQIDKLKRGVDEADEANARQLSADVLSVLGSLLSVVTNVMTLFK